MSNNNMRFPARDEVARVRERYPKGTRIELVKMDDPYTSMLAGMQGTVNYVDDAASIHASWDNGSGLAAVYGVDVVKPVTG